MVVIRRQNPGEILGFVIDPLPDSTLNEVVNAFRRGAFDAYDPTVCLTLDRQRFQGSTAEDIRAAKDGEGYQDPFIIIDNQTEQTQSVWWIDRWADEELDEDVLEDLMQNAIDNVQPGERVLFKLRMPIPEIPDFYVNMRLGITDTLTQLPCPYDPQAWQEPGFCYDWDNNLPQPEPIQVVAAPDEYERSTSPQDLSRFVIPPNGHPEEVVRLKESVALQVGLQSDWAVASETPQGEETPEGSLMFSQPWQIRHG